MNISRPVLVLSIAAALFLAGCTSNPPAGNTTTTTTTTTTGATTTTSTLPITTTLTTPALGAVTSIALLPTPANATAGGNVTACWRVEGTGNIKHTAIHYDNASHNATNATFDAYKGGAAYPNNATALDPAGYNLPGTFCSNVPVGTTAVYFRAHVIDVTGGKGKVSDERQVNATASGS